MALALVTGVQLAGVRELVRDGAASSPALEPLFARLITDLV